MHHFSHPSHPSSFDHPKWHLGRSTEHKVPRYVVFSTPLITASFLGLNILINSLVLEKYQPTFLPQSDKSSLTATQNHRQNPRLEYTNQTSFAYSLTFVYRRLSHIVTTRCNRLTVH
jgi:multidrug efflux pump subunit AcrB